MFLLKKLVDWSLLRQGFTIPVKQQLLWKSLYEESLEHGNKRKIKILCDGKIFDNVLLINQSFDKDKFANHPDVIQIRYNEGSELVKYLRTIFSSSFNTINRIRTERGGKSKSGIVLPDELKEYVILSSTTQQDVFELECITLAENDFIKESISKISENQFEDDTDFASMKDEGAGYTYHPAIAKVRKLDREIGNTLKTLYDFKCQMTGERIGDAQSGLVVEAHHIIPFTKSMNNDASNIIILSPNYHRIVHKTNAEFDYGQLAYKFPNGLVEKVRLNLHLPT